MLFIDALSRVGRQPNESKNLGRVNHRSHANYKDSVDLSSAANQVKEIHLDSQQKNLLTASGSLFANLIEHVLHYILAPEVTIYSPEELNLTQKEWRLFLQVPPIGETKRSSDNYLELDISKRPQPKQLIFHIPVRPAYGNTVEMTLLLSSHHGSPETPKLFSQFPKENNLPALQTPYAPEFISQQITHYHVLLDQDGEPDQLAPLYPHVNQSKISQITTELTGLRLWRARGELLQPIVLGDNKIGLLYIGHYSPLRGNHIETGYNEKKGSGLYTKA